MAIQYSTETEGSLLRVKSAGFDENLAEVRQYSMAILEAALANNSTRILCDETELEYKLGIIDTFELARAMSELAPKVFKIAIVFLTKACCLFQLSP